MSDDLAQRGAQIFRTRLQSLSDCTAQGRGQIVWNGGCHHRTDGGVHGAGHVSLSQSDRLHLQSAARVSRWCQGETCQSARPDNAPLAGTQDHVAQTIAALDGAVAAGIAAMPDKHIDLMGQAHIDLSDQRYVDDWLVPNSYFHLVLVGALLRNHGVDVGKVDQEAAHLAGDVRPNA